MAVARDNHVHLRRRRDTFIGFTTTEGVLHQPLCDVVARPSGEISGGYVALHSRQGVLHEIDEKPASAARGVQYFRRGVATHGIIDFRASDEGAHQPYDLS